MILAKAPETDSLPRLARLGARRLARAHLLIAERPELLAQAARALETACAALSAQVGAPVTARAQLVDSAVNLARALPRNSAFALIDLSSLGAHAVVDVDPAFLAAVLDRLCGGKGKGSPVAELTRIEQVAFGFLCTTVIAALRKTPEFERPFAPRLISIHSRREEFYERLSTRERHLCVDVRMELGDASGAIRILLPASVAQTAVQELPASRPSTFGTTISKVEVPFRVRMGTAHLTPQELIALAPRDVVVMAGMALAEGRVTGKAKLLGSRFDLTGEFGSDGFSVSRAVLRGPSTELPMSNKDEATCMLPIELEVELARVQIPVAELACLKTGAVVPLRINAADPVVLRIGDRVVARAELVEIDGEVGARILSLVG